VVALGKLGMQLGQPLLSRLSRSRRQRQNSLWIPLAPLRHRRTLSHSTRNSGSGGSGPPAFVTADNMLPHSLYPHCCWPLSRHAPQTLLPVFCRPTRLLLAT
jgi:hypothetical protein